MRRVDWVADVSRARSDLQTALGLLMAVSSSGVGDEPPDEHELQYTMDTQRLLRNANEALERAVRSMKEARQ